MIVNWLEDLLGWGEKALLFRHCLYPLNRKPLLNAFEEIAFEDEGPLKKGTLFWSVFLRSHVFITLLVLKFVEKTEMGR